MATRRQEKVGRQIQRAVSEVITNHLSDPRIEGLVSVTRVDVAPDLRAADVYLSVLAKDVATENRTLVAIEHARSRIQAWLAGTIRTRFCPVVRLHRDDQFKKTIEIVNLIDQLADERPAPAGEAPEEPMASSGPADGPAQGREVDADEAPDERQ
jgi:ribosome-binding factor A